VKVTKNGIRMLVDYSIWLKDRQHYHPGKANVVAYALSRKKYCNATFAKMMQPEL
jgi:hypothetical protein